MWKEDLELKRASLDIECVRHWDEVIWSSFARFGRIQCDSGLFRDVLAHSIVFTVWDVDACGLLT